MKTKEVYKLVIGDKVNHKKLGICMVQDVIPNFGPVLQPETEESKRALALQSGADYGTPMLETSFREIIGRA